MAAWKLAPALVPATVVVLKPAESTPISILIRRADCRPAAAGVLNIVQRPRPRGQHAARHQPAHRQIAFTGSTTTGR